MRHRGSVQCVNGILCIAVMRRGWPYITFLFLQTSLYVCRLVGTWGHSSCLSVLLCPLTCVFTFDMCVGCWACRCVIMPRPRHAPTYSSFFEVLSMEGYITWKSLLLSPCPVQYSNDGLLSGSHTVSFKIGENSPKIHVWSLLSTVSFWTGYCTVQLMQLEVKCLKFKFHFFQTMLFSWTGFCNRHVLNSLLSGFGCSSINYGYFFITTY